jgi:hypothetical protein
MKSQWLGFVLSIVAAFAFGGLLRSQAPPEPKAGHVVEAGKTYVGMWSGNSTFTLEFKVVEIVNDCWVKVDKNRKNNNYSRINICSAIALDTV